MTAEIIVTLLWLFNALFMAYLAKERKRSYGLWMFIGLILGPFAWIAFYLFIPPERKEYQ